MPGPGDRSPIAEAADPERTMRFWLARYLRTLREEKDVKRSEIVQWVRGSGNGPIDISTVSNFENDKTWPQKLDALIAAYAVTCGIEDGRAVWKTALKDYVRKGGAPLPNRQPSSAQRSVLLALEAAQRQKPYDDESRDKPTSIPNHRAGGQ